jgi:preprotein translocase subunit SecA
MVSSIREDVLNDVITKYIPAKTMEEQWDVEGLEEHLSEEYLLSLPLKEKLDNDTSFQEQNLRDFVIESLEQSSKDKAERSGDDVMQHFEKSVMLQVLDNSWKEHLAAMDILRQGIHFRGYAQKDPKQEYKRESFDMFTSLLDHIKYEVTGILAKVQVADEEDVQEIDEQRQTPQEMNFEHADVQVTIGEQPAAPAQPIENLEQATQSALEEAEQPFIREGVKVGRNDPCPCGSGSKYKQCHGKLT